LFFIFVFRFVYWDGAMRLSLSQPSLVLMRGILWGGLFIAFYFLSVRRAYRLKPRYDAERGLKG
jgi:hypothetical protein